MPIARFQMPDGRVARFEVPEGTTPEQAQQMIAASLEQGAPPAPAPVPEAASPASESGSALQAAGKYAKAANRGILQGLASLPLTAVDALAYLPRRGYEAITGEPVPGYSDTFDRGLSELGFTPGQSAGERVVSDIGAGVGSAVGGVGLGQQLAKSAGPATRAVGGLLSSAPETQILAGGSAGLSSGLAREAGAGPVGQVAAGMAGGLLGPLVAPRQIGGIPFSAKALASDPANIDATRAAPSAAGPIASGSPEYRQAVGLLDDAGVPLTTGQRTGQNWVKSTERSLSEVPFTGTPLQKTFEGQQRAYQRELLRRAGLDDGSDMITSDVLARARASLSNKYSEALGGKSISLVDDSFIDDLARIEAKHSEMLPFEQRRQVRDIIDQTIDAAAAREKSGGMITGEEYQRLRSNLGEKARSTKNTYISALYDDLKRSFDDAFGRAAGEDKFSIDRQFARLKQLEKILQRNGGPNMSEGFISPVAVSREAAGAPGGRDWQEFARAAAAVLPDRVANSGTAQRNLALGLLAGGAAGAIDPVSLLYGPAMMRGASGLLANGGGQTMLQPGLLARPAARLAVPGLLGAGATQR